jgi:hypothetical protein
MFRWKAGTTPQQVRAVIDALGGLPEAIPEIAEYRFGRDLGLTEGSADFAVVADFASEDDWRVYTKHPAHRRAIEELIAPIRESRMAMQYEFQN